MLTNICSAISLSNNVFRFESWERLESISLTTFLFGTVIDHDLRSILFAAGDMLCSSAAKIKLFLSYLWPFGTLAYAVARRQIMEICHWFQGFKSSIDELLITGLIYGNDQNDFGYLILFIKWTVLLERKQFLRYLNPIFFSPLQNDKFKVQV